MKIVKFLKSWRLYTVGEIAGFDPAVADQLIAQKVAEPYKEAKNEKTDKPTPDK